MISRRGRGSARTGLAGGDAALHVEVEVVELLATVRERLGAADAGNPAPDSLARWSHQQEFADAGG